MMIEKNYSSMKPAMREKLPEMERSLCLSSDVASIQDANVRAAFEAGLEWMHRFVMRAHPALDHKRAVCPFVKPAHERKHLYFSAIDCSEIRFDLFLENMMHARALYTRIADRFAGRRDLLSLCIFPIGLPASAHYKFIDCAHSILKPIYMLEGLMIGEFHPMSVVSGAHSDKLRPLRSDVPFFAVRSMAAHDILFIDRESGSAGQRIHELECYLRWTRDTLQASEVARISARIDQLKCQLVGEEHPAAQTA